MVDVLIFLLGAVAGSEFCRWFNEKRHRMTEIERDETEKEREFYRQLEQMISYSGRKR